MAVCLGSKAALATTLASRPGVPRIAADLLQHAGWQSRANFGRQSVLSEGILPRRLCGDQRKRRSDDSLASSIDCARSNSSSDMVGEGACCRARMKVIKTIDRLGRFEFPGIVSVCPYYNRPTQDGLLQHFAALSDATDRQILIYNIPYRTSVNLSNDTLLRLAQRRRQGQFGQHCAVARTTREKANRLLRADWRGLALFHHDMQRCRRRHLGGGASGYGAVRRGRPSRHVERSCRRAHDLVLAPGLHSEAVSGGKPDADQILPLATGLIRSPECRLPLSSISEGLARELDHWIEKARLPSRAQRT